MSPIYPARLKLAEHAISNWVACVEQGVKREDLMKPEYWSLIAPKCKPWDQIKVLADDGTFYGEYLVLSCGRAWVKVFEMKFVNLTSSDVSVTQADAQDGYTVKWRGPHAKWSVIRDKDASVIHDGEAAEDAAGLWLKDYLKTVA